MTMFRTMAREYGWLLLLLLLATASATAIISCGSGGGGDSEGGLCDQCGDTDGPCISPAFIVPGANEPAPCPTAPLAETCVQRNLICRRGVDTAQQRCYPALEGSTDQVDTFFRCKGTRPGATLRPATVTPSPATPAPTPSKTADPNALCGNGILEGLEQCELGNFDGETCGSQCDNGDATGSLQCVGCFINTSLCVDCS